MIKISIVKDKIASLGYYLFDEKEYVNSLRKIVLVDSLEYKYFLSFQVFKNSIKNNCCLDKFSIDNPYTTENIKKWIKINNCPFIYVSGEYSGSHNKDLILKCLTCGKETTYSWHDLEEGRGCPTSECIYSRRCVGQRRKGVSATSNLEHIFPDISEEWDYSKNKLSPKDYSPMSGRKFWWICSLCGYSWNTQISVRTTGHGCPICGKISRGEQRVEQFLIEKNITYSRQYRNNECRNVLPLPFDFKIVKHENLVLIEYNGKQHYEEREFFGGAEQLKIQKRNDLIKNEYCEKNNINLIVIPYWDFNNIEEILDRELI